MITTKHCMDGVRHLISFNKSAFFFRPSWLHLREFGIMLSSLSNHISTSLITHPHLVQTPSINVDPRSRPKSFLLRLFVIWVGDGQLAVENEVRCESTMGMWRVVGVPAPRLSLSANRLSGKLSRSIAPRKDVFEAPAFDLLFHLLSRLGHGCALV